MRHYPYPTLTIPLGVGYVSANLMRCLGVSRILALVYTVAYQCGSSLVLRGATPNTWQSLHKGSFVNMALFYR